LKGSSASSCFFNFFVAGDLRVFCIGESESLDELESDDESEEDEDFESSDEEDFGDRVAFLPCFRGRFRVDLLFSSTISVAALRGEELAVVGRDATTFPGVPFAFNVGAPVWKKLNKVACFFSMRLQKAQKNFGLSDDISDEKISFDPSQKCGWNPTA
jgi:hypothetical protein